MEHIGGGPHVTEQPAERSGPPERGRGHAVRVAAGIVLTRLLGLVRQRVFAFYFGTGLEADAFQAALKIPNVIRNLLGEGTLSASFIPVYAGLLARGDAERARRLAGSVLSLVVLVAAATASLGWWLAPVVTDIVAVGFEGPRRELTIRLVRVLFPMAGVLIISAWFLGVLNTHRRFFLSYAAPSLWNIAQIGTLVAAGAVWSGAPLAVALAWGAVGGAGLQLVAQIPTVVRLLGGLPWGREYRSGPVRQVVTAWIPVVFGAGVMQISSIIDTQLGTLAGPGSVAILAYAQLFAVLPVSLFGISIAAAALPELSRDAAGEAHRRMLERLREGIRRVLFFIVGAAIVYVGLGDHVVGPVLQTGVFGAEETALVAGVLAAYGVGLPAQGLIKLLTSGHYALGDTRTPVRIAAVSVATGAGLAFVLMLRLGVVGIPLGGAAGAYLNAILNYAALKRRLGADLGTGQSKWFVTTIIGGVIGLMMGMAVDAVIGTRGIVVTAAVVLAAFGVSYVATTGLLGHPDAGTLLRRVWRGRTRGDDGRV